MRQKLFDWLDWCMRRITFLVVLFLIFVGARWYEATYMPVVPDFKIDKAHWDEDVLTVWGLMDKVRPCAFHGLQVFYVGADGKRRKAFVPQDNPLVSRPPIEQRFGPKFVHLPRLGDVPDPNDVYVDGTPLSFWTTHVCHTGWTSYSKVADFTPPPRP